MLQIEVTGPVITATNQDKIVQAEYILKCWKKGDNIEIDTPVIDKKFPVQCKTETADGKPLSELLERAKKKVVEEMQFCIKVYNRLQIIANKQAIKDSSANIQSRLEG